MAERVSRSAVFLTIVTTDYWPRAATLAASLQEAYGGEADLLALHVGDPPATPFPAQPGLRMVELHELALPSLWDMAFRYDKGAFANALKPFFIAHILETLKASAVVFLDADTLIFDRFDEVHADLADGRAAIILTPHFDRPQERVREPLEIDLLRAGVMNGGFVAVSSAASARDFLAWWSGHLLTDCRYELEAGYYGDQHWLALVPALFDDVQVLRHRGYNASYWNYPDRRPREADGRWWVEGAPLRFYHFSQWRLEQGESVADCMRRLYWSDDPDLELLLRRYRDRWLEKRDLLPERLRSARYPFATFLDGSPIPKIVRDAYGRSHPSRSCDRDALFGEGLALVMGRAVDVPVFPGVPVTELYRHIWRSRPDLHHHDLATREGQRGFLRWLLEHGAVDYDLPQEALAPAWLSLAGERAGGHPVRILLQQAAATHAGLRAKRATIGDLSSHAAHLLRLFTQALGAVVPSSEPIEGGAGFFRAVDALKQRISHSREAVEARSAFTEIEAHGRYLAGKLGLDYPDFLEDPTPIEDVMLEADAILNGCSVLAASIEREAERAAEAAASSLLPSSEREGAETGDDLPAGLPAWAAAQFADLAAIDPHLDAAIGRMTPGTAVSRMRPPEHPLQRCLEANQDVLAPAPLAVIGLGGPGGSMSGFDGHALVRGAQDALGVDNVLVWSFADGPGGPIAGLPDATRVFARERWEPYLSGPQCAAFARAFLATAQPRFIVNGHCRVLWDLFRDYGKPLSATSRLSAVLSTVAGPGAPAGFAASHLLEAMPHLAAVYVDSAHAKAMLQRRFAFPPSWSEKIQVLYQPVTAGEAPPPRPGPGDRPRIAWAATGGEPRPELLVEIAAASPAFAFEAYGLAPDAVVLERFALANLRDAGRAASPEAWLARGFDAFVSTACDGDLSPLLLTAGAMRIPIIAASAGGVAEAVTRERGWPIDADAEADAYRDALTAALTDAEGRRRKVAAMAQHVERTHSRRAYALRLKELRVFHDGAALAGALRSRAAI